MVYQVLSRKWRPKIFEDVIGQTHVVKSLKNMIEAGKIGHAYLFSGTRGVGKTTLARIFAKTLKCTNRQANLNPCLKCQVCLDIDKDACLDVLEIDGASNNSVDNIRQLIDNVNYIPLTGNYKIYIIDEVHMLSTSAFNALLKTLEDPPKHVVFIFATTEIHKLPDTVLSRCQRYDLRNVLLKDLVEQLKKIFKAENIKVENNTILENLCRLGEGSVRDTLSIVDQVLNYCENSVVTEAAVTEALGLAKISSVNDIVNAILMGNTDKVKTVYESLLLENVEPTQIAKALLDKFFEKINQFDESAGYSRIELFWIFETLTKDLDWILKSINSEKVLEVLLLKITLRRLFFKSEKSIPETVAVPQTKPVEVVKVEAEIAQPEPALASTPMPVEAVATIAPALPVFEPQINFEERTWKDFLTFIFKKSPASAANLGQGNILNPIKREGGELLIELGFKSSGKIFLDYLQDKAVFEKLVKNIAEFFGVNNSDVRLVLTLLAESEETESTFLSVMDEEEKKITEEKSKTEYDLVNDPLVRKAEQLFNAKVDKVILNTRN